MKPKQIQFGPDEEFQAALICAWCGETLTGAFEVSDEAPVAKPKAGTAMICTSCGNANLITEGMQLRKASVEEIEQIPEAVRKVVKLAMRHFKLRRAIRSN